MPKLALVVLCLVLSAAVSARPAARPQSPASPDGFSRFALNETSLEETLEALGQPDADKTDKLDVSKLAKWLDKKHEEKIFRRLSYRKSPDFSKIDLSFLDGKLIMIDLEFKKNFKPERLPNLFAIQFANLGGPASLPDKPGQYPVPFYATGFPPAYTMIGISEKTFILVNCESAGAGSDPGRVTRTRQISRALEKK